MDVFILEPITQELAKQVVIDVHKAKHGDEIKVHIMSMGGDMLAGNAIYAALVNSPARVTTNVIGIAASMAAVISQAGDVRLISSDASFNVHNGAIRNIGRGTKEDHHEAIQTLSSMDASMVKSFKKTGLTGPEIESLMRADRLITAEDAVKLGFFDAMSEPIRAVASFNKQLDNMSKLSELMEQVDIAAIKMGLKEPSEEKKELVAALETELEGMVEETTEQVLEQAETPAEVLGSEMVPREEFEMFKAEILALIQPLLGAVEEMPSEEATVEIVEEATTAKLTKLMEAIRSKTVAPNPRQVFEDAPEAVKEDWSVYEARKQEIANKNQR